jgi:hypothetical protein
MDVIPQLDLKLSNTRWSKYLEGRLQISPATKKEECCREVDLVPPWARTFAVAKDQVLNCLTRNLLGLSRDIATYGELQ